MQIHIKHLLCIIAISILCGFIGGDRLRAVKAGNVLDNARRELAAERARNTELEILYQQNGIELNQLREDNNNLRAELTNANGIIDSLSSLQFSDVSTFYDIREILAYLRAKIKEAQEYDYTPGLGDPD